MKLPGLLLLLLLTIGRARPEHRPNSDMANLLHRPIRAVTYPSSSTMGIFLALAVPLEDPLNSVSLSYFFEATYELPVNSSLLANPYEGRSRRKRSIDRSAVYAVLQNKFESAGFPGQGCLLRSICEASEHPLQHNGVLGDLLHVLFTPSSSRPEEMLPDGVVEAELSGRAGSCDQYLRRCPLGIFDLISVVQ